MDKKRIKFIDLFAGMGGIRLGFEQAIKRIGFVPECVLTSEIKPTAISALEENFNLRNENFVGDICGITDNEIKNAPDFDFLLAGFPCQAFSKAGKMRGFLDTRGTLFFEVERIINIKKPYGFLLENVEGLIHHDKESSTDDIGRTLLIILQSLERLGYSVTWKALDAQNFGVPQSRTRIFIVGTKDKSISLDDFPTKRKTFGDIMEKGLAGEVSETIDKLLEKFSPSDLCGKKIHDKRGGPDNIHSWEIGLRGNVSDEERTFLNILIKERRKKHWASKIGIDWKDGMPLTKSQIETFYQNDHLQTMLDNLTTMGYLSYEHPRKLLNIVDEKTGLTAYERIPDETKEKGYNIVTGKLSFEFSRFIDPDMVSPTMVAMDMSRIGVVDATSIRHLTIREGLRLFGYPEKYSLNFLKNDKSGTEKAFDLLGNSVCVPVVKNISERLLDAYLKDGG